MLVPSCCPAPFARRARHAVPKTRDGSGPRSATRIRVLIVEDDPDVARALTRILRGPFEVVATAPTVDAALALPEGQSPGVIVLDLLLLEGENAWLRLREIRERFPEARIVIHTGYPELAPVAEALAAGVTGDLVKSDDIHVTEWPAVIRAVAVGTVWLSDTAERLLQESRTPGPASPGWPATVPALRAVPPDHPERETLERLRSALEMSPERLVYAVGVRYGLSYRQIATAVGRTESAVRIGMGRLFRRTGIHNREELARLMMVLVG